MVQDGAEMDLSWLTVDVRSSSRLVDPEVVPCMVHEHLGGPKRSGPVLTKHRNVADIPNPEAFWRAQIYKSRLGLWKGQFQW